MTVAGIAMVKDELDILPWTLPRMKEQVDLIVIADNMSTDGTWEWLCTYAMDSNIVVMRDDRVAYLQSQKMTTLGEIAREHYGADWVVPFDADEVWEAEDGRLADVLEASPAIAVGAVLHNHIVTGDDDTQQRDVVERMEWRLRDDGALPKVACRPLPGFVIEMGNHGVRYPRDDVVVDGAGLVIHHYPYRSARQMIRKARNGAEAYRVAGSLVPAGTGAHWRQYGEMTDAQITEVFERWFFFPSPASSEEVVRCVG